ncbi:MAG: hypothetical protein BV456_12300, partial [Thermoplasmata archaeon M8B2D]
MFKSKKFRIIPDYGDSNNPKIRAKYGYLEATVSIIGNALLFLLKLFLGLFINSIALIADGVHSLSDVSTSGIVIFGFRISKKESDQEHPFGHGRAEYIATLIIAILLIIVGLGFIQQSIERIINPEYISHQEYVIIISIVVLISAVVKELMARYSIIIAKKINSDVLKADAWHHRSDAISSIGVAIGILGARYGFPILDPIFGIIVSIVIIYVGIDLMKRSSNILMGTKIEKETISQIEEIVKSTGYAKNLHNVFLHDYGTNKVITLHVEIDSNLSLEKAHEIADNLEEKIQNKTKFSTVIHLEPSRNRNKNKKSYKIIEKILKSQNEIKSFHKIQIIDGIKKDEIKMHLVVNHNMSVQK